MGTSESGRYLNTAGSTRKMSEFAIVHSDEGTFKKRRSIKEGEKRLRLNGGGHGQKGLELLDKYGVKYNILHEYPNGVRVGNVPDHGKANKRSGTNQAWFPKSWTDKTIMKAGEHVAGLKKNRNPIEGNTYYGWYKGVNVGIKINKGKIATAFPNSVQTTKKPYRRGK